MHITLPPWRRRHERRLLEIGAGSFRDVAALNRWGVFGEGVDFSSESVERARKIQPAFSDKIKQMDAACLDYPDGAFDLTYHNGFWYYLMTHGFRSWRRSKPG